MRAYVITTGLIFAAIVLAHGARVAVEGPGMLGDPVFLLTSALAIALAGWALVLVRRPR